MAAILFDLGGTYLRCAISGDDGALANLHKARIETFLDGHEPRAVWDKILSQMTTYTESVRGMTISGTPVILAFPGPIEAHQRILNAPTVTGGDVTIPDLRSELMNLTKRDVYILNDVSAAAWHFSRKLAIGRFMVVTISSGIGSKIFDRQHPECVFDAAAYAGEIGHLVVDESPNAPKCDCGGIGHLGAIASGRGIERAARSRAQKNQAAFESSACARDFKATPVTLANEQHLVPAAKAGDEWALTTIRESTRPLARVLGSMVLGIGLQGIVIIGGFALSLGQVYLNLLRNLTKELCDYSLLSDQLPGLVQLGDESEEACLEGAADYASRIVQPRL